MGVGLVPNEGLFDELEYIIKRTISGVNPWDLYLYTNGITPNALTVFADLVDATFTGYTHQSLTRSNWTTPVLSVDRVSSTWGTTPILFTNTGITTETIRGYAFVDPILLVLRGIQALDPCDIIPLVPGGMFAILPTFVYRGSLC